MGSSRFVGSVFAILGSLNGAVGGATEGGFTISLAPTRVPEAPRTSLAVPIDLLYPGLALSPESTPSIFFTLLKS